MRITADQKIAGYPAVQIRQLMRETVGRSITPRYVWEILQCSDSVALQVLNHLQTEGFVDSVNGHLEPSVKGSALAMATAAPPLRRDTAERLITQLVERARAINKDDRWAYRVGRLVVFGSYVRAAERPNDVDVGCEMVPRWSGERQQVAEQHRREVRKERFRNVSDWATWPKWEVIRFLKSRRLSIQELDDWILQLDHEIVFTDYGKTD